MINRSGRSKTTDPVNKTPEAGHARSGTAAKQADVEAFGRLVGELKRINSRLNDDARDKNHEVKLASEEHHPRPSVRTNAEPTSAGPRSLTDLSSPSLQFSAQSASVPVGKTTSFDINLNETHASDDITSTRLKAIEKISEIVDRIIDKCTAPEPRTWVLQLKVEGFRTTEIAIEYSGDNQWAFGLFDSDSRQDEQSLFGHSKDEIFLEIRNRISEKQPGISLSELSANTGAA
jgi:hypothetical protein